MKLFFSWLRNGVRAAILDGVDDALLQLDSHPAALPEALRERFQPALPAPEPTGRKKSDKAT